MRVLVHYLKSKTHKLNFNRNSLVSVRADFVLTIVSSLAMAFTLMVFNVLAANILTASELGKFQSVRNIAILLVPLVTLSQAISLPRHMAKGKYVLNYAFSSFAIFYTVSAILILLVYFFDNVLNDVAPKKESTIIICIAIGIGSVRLIEGFFRGLGKIYAATLIKGPINALVYGLVLISIVVNPTAFSAINALLISLSFIFVLSLFLYGRLLMTNCRFNYMKKPFCGSLKFGFTRTPAGLLKTIIITLPFVYMSSRDAFIEAAIYSVGLYFLRIIEVSVAGLNPSVVYQTSKLHTHYPKKLKTYISSLLEGVILMSLLAVSFLNFWIEYLLLKLFGSSYEEYAFHILLLATVAVPQCIFLVLRGVVDTLYSTPWNTINLLVSVLLQAYVIFIYMPDSPIIHSSIVSVIVSTTLIATMTILLLRKHLVAGFVFSEYIKIVLTVLTILSANYFVHFWSQDGIALVVSIVISGLLFIFFVKFIKFRWVNVLFTKGENF